MKSLKNKTILITKSESDAGKFVQPLVEEGAKIIYFPAIKIIPKTDSPDLSGILNRFEEFDYLIFTSTNAAEVFSGLAENYSLDLTKIKIAAVGFRTADECESLGMKIDILPDEFSTKGLIKKFSGIDILGKKIFIPGSALSNDDLKLGLTELGAQVITLPVYDVIPNDFTDLAEEYREILKHQPDVYVFTSPSSFDGFIKLMKIKNIGDYFNNSIICSIGSTTEIAISNSGVTVHIVPKEFSLQGISEAIIKYFHTTVNMV